MAVPDATSAARADNKSSRAPPGRTSTRLFIGEEASIASIFSLALSLAAGITALSTASRESVSSITGRLRSISPRRLPGKSARTRPLTDASARLLLNSSTSGWPTNSAKPDLKSAGSNGKKQHSLSSDASIFGIRPAFHAHTRQFVVVRNDLSNAGKAANEIKKMLGEAGVEKKIIRRVAVAAYELEINICIHSLGGSITFILDGHKATIIAKDKGPGIKDVEWALRDGTSTANDWIRSMGFGAGMGLSNSKRVADFFDIKSTVPTGTTVLCEFNLPEKK